MPSRLQAQIESILVRNSTDDPFDLSTPMVPWKASTVATYRRYLKRYFGLLVMLGHAPETLQGLSDLVRFERAKPTGLDHMITKQGCDPVSVKALSKPQKRDFNSLQNGKMGRTKIVTDPKDRRFMCRLRCLRSDG